MSDHFIELPPQIDVQPQKPIIGICAMDNKARSRPMTHILDRLLATGRYSVVVFGEKSILDEPVEEWPLCDFLISFFSQGFPLDKALQYTRLRKPFSVNSLVRQYLLMDRRIVLHMLERAHVPTPHHLVVSRDGGPQVNPLVRQVVEQRLGLVFKRQPMPEVVEIGEDTLRVGNQVIHKPFVEKPCDAEDHNIYIYYSKSMGGGVRKLFRKIGNRSSEFYPGHHQIRQGGSFIYEEFVAVDNSVDVKVYTVGRRYAHAETRKSPVVDGHVRRNTEGKEIRYVTELTKAEQKYASQVSNAFGQRVCGFDMLRAEGRESMVIDVNGWSFVKGNQQYYNDAARILDERFQEALRRRWFARFVDPDTVGRATYESRWVLKSVLAVCRHADRTPKQKIKLNIEREPFKGTWIGDWLEQTGGARCECILREPKELADAQESLETALTKTPDNLLLAHLVDVLKRKIDMAGTKIQLKPQQSDSLVQMVLKWGGECTHAGTVQSLDLGETMRRDLLLINPRLLGNVKIYSSSERRVQSTIASYTKTFLPDDDTFCAQRVDIRSDMLDDSSVAKDEMEVAKTQLREFFNYEGTLDANPYYTEGMQPLSKEMEHQPRQFLQGMCELMQMLIDRMESNFKNLSQEGEGASLGELQQEWCCNETAELFRERWKKILSDFRTKDKKTNTVVFDPAKVGELYDSLKYDALHNRKFLERIFMSSEQLTEHRQDGETEDLLFTQQEVRALYYKAKLLFDYVTPREYGIGEEQRKKIGIQASVPLLRQLLHDLEEAQQPDEQLARTRLYFTKESHIHTLLNLVFLCDMPTMIPYEDVGELDYLTHIIFEVYERKADLDADLQGEYSVRIGFSPGANCLHVLDMNIDQTHALKVLPRKNFTRHMPLNDAIGVLRDLLNDR